jgi:biopolymer transport protein ExbD
MSDKRFLDVWIIETNTVYKEVPYTVVTDWLQQGRLLEDDKAKPSGTRDWARLGDLLELQPFLPRVEPGRVEDQAEALESVHLDFAYKRPAEEEDDDVDMIPLIDVSLVLLVFFMLTASTAAVAHAISVPETEHGIMSDTPAEYRIDIDLDENGNPVYSLGLGDKPAEEEERNLHSAAAVLDRLRARLVKTSGTVELQINANKELKAKVCRDLLLGLRAEPFRSRISESFFGVNEKES